MFCKKIYFKGDVSPLTIRKSQTYEATDIKTETDFQDVEGIVALECGGQREHGFHVCYRV